MATINGQTGSKTFYCTLNYVTQGGSWAYTGGAINDVAYFYVDLPAEYGSITSCKLLLKASMGSKYLVKSAYTNGAAVYMANNSATTGNQLTNIAGSTYLSTNGTTFTFDSAALEKVNTAKPKQLGVKIAVASSGSSYTPTTTITQSSGQTASFSGRATLTVSEFYIEVEYTPPVTGAVNYYDGSTWKRCNVYRYDGSKWEQCKMYRYDGSDWIECGCQDV